MEIPVLGRLNGSRPVALRLGLAAQLLGLVGALALTYGQALADLANQWLTDENYSHGVFIPLVSAYLLWERRQALSRCSLRGSAWGYGVLVAGLALLVAGQAAKFGYPVRLSFIVVLAGLTLFLAGAKALRIVAFPLAYLLFMIPLPAPVLTKIAFPLQLLAAKVATAALDLLNVPVFREGNIVNLAAARLDVVEACSGIRSLVALLALATIFAYFSQRTWQARLILVLSAIPIAIVANAARVALTGVLAQTFGVTAALGFYHEFTGLLVFGVAFALMMAVGGILARLAPAKTGT